ncbi:MAG: 6-bladed beta-propeller [Acidobacteriota bacterium]
MRKGFFLLIFSTIFLLNLSGEKIVKMSDLNNPATIIVDGGQILIAEFPTIYVYSQKDYSFITKFGKKGDGPREFSQYTRIQKDPKNPDKIVIGSHMKMSYYTRDGKFISEKRPKTGGRGNIYKPFGDKFVSYSGYQDKEKKTVFQTVELYNSDLKKIKRVYEEPQVFQQGKKINPLRTWGAWFRLYGKKIFITGEKDGYVLIFDKNGNSVKEIKCGLKKLKVRDTDIKRYHEYFRTDPQTKNFYENVKALLDFPSYFPIIRGMDVVDNKLYVNGYMNPEGKTEFIIYDMDWNVAGKDIFLEIPEASARDLYPYTIKDDKLYQLVDNDDEEMWELHIHELK